MEILEIVKNAFCYCGFAGLIGLGFTIGCGIGKKILNMINL